MMIDVGKHYIYENDLVLVVGMHGTGSERRFMIQWGDSQGRACAAEVQRRELSPAPTMERLYGDYKACLDVICQQANKIEELEDALKNETAARVLWQEEAHKLRGDADVIPF